MPTYEYQCQDKTCNAKIDAFHKMSDDPMVFCPHCGEKTLKRLISAANFILKGTGWYKTTEEPKEPKKETKTDDD